MKLSILFCAFPFYMTDDAPAAEPTESTDAAPASTEPPAVAPATVAVDVPVQHVGLIERIVALLGRGEMWIMDNVHAGIETLENVAGVGKDADKS